MLAFATPQENPILLSQHGEYPSGFRQHISKDTFMGLVPLDQGKPSGSNIFVEAFTSSSLALRYLSHRGSCLEASDPILRIRCHDAE